VVFEDFVFWGSLQEQISSFISKTETIVNISVFTKKPVFLLQNLKRQFSFWTDCRWQQNCSVLKIRQQATVLPIYMYEFYLF